MGFHPWELKKKISWIRIWLSNLVILPIEFNLLTDLEALNFENCYELRKELEIGGLVVKFIDVESLIIAKRAAGRMQDLADVEKLESGKNDET